MYGFLLLALKEPYLKQWYTEMIMISRIIISTITRLENQRVDQKLKRIPERRHLNWYVGGNLVQLLQNTGVSLRAVSKYKRLWCLKLGLWRLSTAWRVRTSRQATSSPHPNAKQPVRKVPVPQKRSECGPLVKTKMSKPGAQPKEYVPQNMYLNVTSLKFSEDLCKMTKSVF